MKKYFISMFAVGCSLLSQATETNYDILLSSCKTTRSWGFHNGGEYPGAKGGLSTDKARGKIQLNYDFSQGGQYVSAFLKSELPNNIKSFALEMVPNQDVTVNYRITDANGQTFQGKPRGLKANQRVKSVFNTDGPWTGSWGGNVKSKNPQQPFKKMYLTVFKKGGETGSIQLNSFTARGSAPLQPELGGEDFDFTALGWKLAGKWNYSLEGIYLDIDATNLKGSDIEMNITMPTMMRDNVQRFKLNSKQKNVKFTYLPQFKYGVNRFNKYNVTLSMRSANGKKLEVPITLNGVESDKINFGTPTNSNNIKASSFGTAVHFSYGTSGPFKGWRPYKELIDDIAECGIKWIRDGAKLKKDEQGNYYIRQYDLDWMKYARSKGINIILEMGLSYKYSIAEHKKKIDAYVRDSKPYVNVYELGNEPQNFGWRQHFGGPWNGKGENNEASPWVIEHLKYTNALADHTKKLAPEATVIGIGACTPTNFRYLDLGVTKNLDGVVDHPYTYSMPPESIPFGWEFEERDGVKTGDEHFTFKGMIDSYIAKFKETGQMRSLWVTEFGYTTFWFGGSKNNGKFGLYAGVTEEAQAVYLTRRIIESFTLPIEATCQYDFIDDYGSGEIHDESNFGIIRADHSKKPSYYALQRMSSLFNGYDYDNNTNVIVEKQTLHRSAKRHILVQDWDGVDIKADNNIRAYTFNNPELENERMLAVWSALPYSREFNNRIVTIRIKGLGDFSEKPVAIDIVNGNSYTVPMEVDGNDIVLKNLSLKGNPIVIKFIKK